MNTSNPKNKTTVSKETKKHNCGRCDKCRTCENCGKIVSGRNAKARGLCEDCFGKVPCGNKHNGCNNTIGPDARERFNKGGVNARCPPCVADRMFLSLFLMLFNFYEWLMSGDLANYNDDVARYQPDIDAIEVEFQRRLSALEKEAADERARVLGPLQHLIDNHFFSPDGYGIDRVLEVKKTRLENASNRIDKKYSKMLHDVNLWRAEKREQMSDIIQRLEESKSALRRSRINFEKWKAMFEHQHEHATDCPFVKASKTVDPRNTEHLRVFGKVDQDGHFHYEGFRCICQDSLVSSESSELSGEDMPAEISEDEWNEMFPELQSKKQNKKM
jgi:hypothetical protein